MAIKKFNPNDYKPPSMGIVTNTKPIGRSPGSVSGVSGGGAGGSAPTRTFNTMAKPKPMPPISNKLDSQRNSPVGSLKPPTNAKPPNMGYITNKPKPVSPAKPPNQGYIVNKPKPKAQAKPPNNGYIVNKPKSKIPDYLNPAKRKPKAAPKIPDYLNPAKRKNKKPM